jgi:signal transduction histidine kinase
VSRARADRVSLVAGIAIALVGAALCLDQLDLIELDPSLFRDLGIWWSAAVVGPLVLAAAGAALLWAFSRSDGDHSAPPAGQTRVGGAVATGDRPAPSQAARLRDLYRGGFGVALVVGAALLFLSQVDALGGARDAAFTAIVAVFALALILAPFIWRLGRNLAAERAERIRSQERAEMAAHLHDSVLQTLTLMQKRAADPREVAALARRQERELRGWLSSGRAAGAGGFAEALRTAAEEVEDAHRVEIDVVTVGDCALDDGTAALVAAAREALTNAAKFAGEDGPVSVYAEVAPELVEAFVRDRGAGFDVERVPGDRQGVRESIIGRMRRHGGDATIASVPGSGTEVALSIPREAR